MVVDKGGHVHHQIKYDAHEQYAQTGDLQDLYLAQVELAHSEEPRQKATAYVYGFIIAIAVCGSWAEYVSRYARFAMGTSTKITVIWTSKRLCHLATYTKVAVRQWHQTDPWSTSFRPRAWDPPRDSLERPLARSGFPRWGLLA